MIRRLSLPLALLCALTWSGRVAGQDPEPTDQPPARDPFQAAGADEVLSQDLPPITVGGLVVMRDRPSLAMLRLGDQAHVVRVGAVLHVDAAGQRVHAATQQRVELRVTAIDRDGVTLRVGEADVVIR